MKIISSNKNLSVNEILALNNNYTYDFNHENYYVYFAPYAVLLDGTLLTYSQLAPYFNFSYQYEDETYILRELPYESCYRSQQDIFLGLDSSIINADAGVQAKYDMCLVNNSIKMGIFVANGAVSPSIVFSISPCKNSSANNNSCVSMPEINDIVRYLDIQATIPRAIFDFENVQSPKKRIYDYIDYFIDQSFSQTTINSLVPVSLYTDTGIFSEDYQLNSVDFNSQQVNSHETYRTSEYSPFFTYKMTLGFETQSYYRQNDHLLDILGSLGGAINVFVLIARIMCFFYNNLYQRYILVNETFEPLQDHKRKGK